MVLGATLCDDHELSILPPEEMNVDRFLSWREEQKKKQQLLQQQRDEEDVLYSARHHDDRDTSAMSSSSAAMAMMVEQQNMCPSKRKRERGVSVGRMFEDLRKRSQFNVGRQ